ncbi:MAG: hypothetical protein ACI9RO_002346 [Alteromonas macleodii]|jgi:hypothetical protein
MIIKLCQPCFFIIAHRFKVYLKNVYIWVTITSALIGQISKLIRSFSHLINFEHNPLGSDGSNHKSKRNTSNEVCIARTEAQCLEPYP